MIISDIKESFSKILDNVVFTAHKKKLPLSNNKCVIVVGDMSIERKNKVYNVVDIRNNNIVYEDLYLIESALLLAKCPMLDKTRISKIKHLDNMYSNYYSDMTHFTYMHKNAKTNDDYDQMSIQQARYQMTKMCAQDTKEQVQRMYDKITLM